MDISLVKLLVDTGLFILIWIVQIVIYPSFIYYTEQNLKRWHSKYSKRISIIVLPLMVGQLIIYGYSLTIGWVTTDLLIAGLVIFNWVVTFTMAVPLHNKIEGSKESMVYRHQLVKINWLRTIAWTLIFIINLSSNYAK